MLFEDSLRVSGKLGSSIYIMGNSIPYGQKQIPTTVFEFNDLNKFIQTLNGTIHKPDDTNVAEQFASITAIKWLPEIYIDNKGHIFFSLCIPENRIDDLVYEVSDVGRLVKSAYKVYNIKKHKFVKTDDRKSPYNETSIPKAIHALNTDDYISAGSIIRLLESMSESYYEVFGGFR